MRPFRLAQTRADTAQLGDLNRLGSSMIKKATLVLFLILFASVGQLRAQTVYITDTGEKYHKSGCTYLRSSKNATSLSDALNSGYEACKVCARPKLHTNQKKDPLPIEIRLNKKSIKALNAWRILKQVLSVNGKLEAEMDFAGSMGAVNHVLKNIKRKQMAAKTVPVKPHKRSTPSFTIESNQMCRSPVPKRSQ